jgi:hypothetical protein
LHVLRRNHGFRIGADQLSWNAAGERNRGRSRRGLPARARAVDRYPIGRQVDLDRTVGVGSQDVRHAFLESGDRRRRRVTVGIAGACRDDRNRGSDSIEERRRRRRSTAVVGHLEDVDMR